MRRVNSTVVALVVLLSAGLGQYRIPGTRSSLQEQYLTGDFRYDLDRFFRQLDGAPDSVSGETRMKSGLAAAAYSILLPGAGEFYAENNLKAGSFLGAEVGLWILYAAYTSKGDNQTNIFQDYADEHWSVVKYAQWIEQYGTQLNSDVTDNSGLVTSTNTSLPPWQRVDWAKINKVEAEIGLKTGTFFSHQLPMRPEQQYYELIGKYPQFNPGWDDANVDASNFHTALTQRFLDYSAMRGKANDFYNIASTAAKLVVVNHVLSALDAAWTASQYNKSVKLEAHVKPVQRDFGMVEFVPTAQLCIRF